MAKLTLTLIRGLPGSGKSTLAKTLEAVHLEADMYFVDNKGDYCFNPAFLKKAHQWCQDKCEQTLKQGNNVVVSNTFIKQWEMDAYRTIAQRNKAVLDIRVCSGEYETIHNVPVATIMKMKREWEK